MHQVARKGDRALVLGLETSELGLPIINGTIVDVLTDPYVDVHPFWINGSSLVNNCESHICPEEVLPTWSLIPIRDPDAEQTKAETKQKERAV